MAFFFFSFIFFQSSRFSFVIFLAAVNFYLCGKGQVGGQRGSHNEPLADGRQDLGCMLAVMIY